MDIIRRWWRVRRRWRRIRKAVARYNDAITVLTFRAQELLDAADLSGMGSARMTAAVQQLAKIAPYAMIPDDYAKGGAHNGKKARQPDDDHSDSRDSGI